MTFIRVLKTVDEVLDACGGTGYCARLTKRREQAVSNWRSEKRIAAGTYEIFKAQLRKQKLTASPMLWGIELPPKAKRKKVVAS